MTEILKLEHLEKSFGDHVVLRDINLSVSKGEVISVIGSSGSGKSTMLRCINLLEEPTGGRIIFEGNDISDKKNNVTSYRARVGMVFQQFNLFNNMNVLENCVCPQVTVLKKSRADAEKTAREYLAKVGMDSYINARPKQLSGGQKQRVAIARSLSMHPDIILFDEPTSALDPEMVDVYKRQVYRRSVVTVDNPRNARKERGYQEAYQLIVGHVDAHRTGSNFVVAY